MCIRDRAGEGQLGGGKQELAWAPRKRHCAFWTGGASRRVVMGQVRQDGPKTGVLPSGAVHRRCRTDGLAGTSLLFSMPCAKSPAGGCRERGGRAARRAVDGGGLGAEAQRPLSGGDPERVGQGLDLGVQTAVADVGGFLVGIVVGGVERLQVAQVPEARSTRHGGPCRRPARRCRPRSNPNFPAGWTRRSTLPGWCPPPAVRRAVRRVHPVVVQRPVTSM